MEGLQPYEAGRYQTHILLLFFMSVYYHATITTPSAPDFNIFVQRRQATIQTLDVHFLFQQKSFVIYERLNKAPIQNYYQLHCFEQVLLMHQSSVL